jgi:hypothetical protein
MRRVFSMSLFLVPVLFLTGEVRLYSFIREANAEKPLSRSQNIPAEKIDEYPAYNCEDEMAVLDSYAPKIQVLPESKAYVIVYGGQRRRRGEIRMRISRIAHYLTTNRKIPATRIIIVDGGYRQKLTIELWSIGPAASAPRPTPSLRPNEVRFKRGKIQKWEYKCERLG